MQFGQLKRRQFITLLGGSAAAWPLAVRAQPKVPVVGVLRPNPRDVLEVFAEPFRRYMRAIGWDEGRNVRFHFVWAEGRSERAPALASELVTQNVDVIIAFGDPAIRACQHATQTIPIVGMTDDMVGSGFAVSLARPANNTTGVSILASELDVKRLEILHEFVPQARRMAALVDPTTISTRDQLVNAARKLGVELVTFEASDPDQLGRALDSIAAGDVAAVNVLASPFLQVSRLEIIRRMQDYRLPAIYQWPESAEDGGLLAYGPRQVLCYRLVVSLVDKILRGAKPADLPIEQPSKFELIVNLKTATAVDITISAALLLRADEVIE
jgi:putative ABC transport system substrate-binding protein